MNAISYIRNVGRSFGYIAVDVVKDYNPAITSMARSAKDLSSDLYQTVSDFKSNISSKAIDMNLKDELKGLGGELRTNIFEDLKSGKWYNSDRIDKYNDLDFESFNGISFGGDDDFGDFDFEFEDSVDDSTKAELAQDQMNTKALINSMDVVGSKTANAVATATVRSADYVVASQRESTRALYGITKKGFEGLSVGLGAINANISMLSSIAEPINIHIQNSTTFYTKSSEYQDKSLKLLEKIAENTAPVKVNSSSYKKKYNTIGDLITDGGIDFQAWKDMVTKNINDSFGFLFGGGMGGGFDIKSLKRNITKSPISTIMTAAMKGMMPKIAKEAMKEFNEYLGGYFATALGTMRSKSTGNLLLDFLKDFIAPQSNYKDKINTGNYHKGKIDWEGQSRKALMEVIPEQLSYIVSALTGRPRELFDYDTGKWKRVSNIESEFRKFKNNSADMAGYEFISEMKNLIDKMNKGNEDQRKTMKAQLDTFNRTAFHSNSDEFMRFEENGFPYWKYGLDRETWEFMRQFSRVQDKSGKRSKKMKYFGEHFTERDSFGDKIRDKENNGSIFGYLFNHEDNIKEDEKTRTIFGVDQYNNDLFYYLQGIYLHTRHLSDNIEVFAPGGTIINGSSIESNGKIKPIRRLRTRVNRSEVDKRNNNIGLFSTTVNEVESAYLSNMESIKGKPLPDDPELRQYAMRKYSNDKNFEKDEDLEKRLKAFEESKKATNWIKQKLSNTSIGKYASKAFESILGLLQSPAEMVSKLVDAAEVSMNRLLTGNKADGEKGILDLAQEGFSNLFESLGNKLESIFPIGKFKQIMNTIFGTKGEDGKRRGTSLSGFANDTSASLGMVGNWFKNIFVGGNDIPKAANGRMVTRSGVVAVSDGELIIPAEYNPFYHKRVNKRNQHIKENIAANRFFGYFADGGSIDGEQLNQNGTGDTKKQTIHPNSFLGNLLSFVKQGGKEFGQDAKELWSQIIPNKEGIEKEKKSVSKVIQSALEDLGASRGAMGAGALIGGGVSLLTGGMISPILGASLGAAGGLIINSEKVQNALFGYTKDGKFNEGLFKKETGEAIKKYAPALGAGAAVGGVAGLFAGSPVAGAIMGSAIGFAAKNESFQKYLFGEGGFGNIEGKDSGLFSKKLQAKVKEAFPKMSAGAIAGLVAGPFGVIPNIVLGSALGYASTTDKFKNWLFGKEGKDGKKEGGFVELLKDRFLDPLLGIFDHLAQQIKHTIRNTFHNLGKGIHKMFSNFFKGGSLGGRAIRAVGRGANKITGGALTGATGLLMGARDILTSRGLAKGFSIRDFKEGRNLTAAERLEKRQNNRWKYGSIHDTYAGIDEIIANIQDEEELNSFRNTIDQAIDPTRAYDSKIRQSYNSARNILGHKLSGTEFSNKDELKSARKSYEKISRLIDKGNYNEARALARDLFEGKDDKTYSDLLTEINNHERLTSDRNNAKGNSKALRQKLIQNSKWAGTPLEKVFSNIKDSDLMNVKDLLKDEEFRFGKDKEKLAEDSDKATVEMRDLVKEILNIMQNGGSGSTGGRPLNAKKGDTWQDDSGKKYIHNGIDWEIDDSDSETREQVETENYTTNSIGKLNSVDENIKIIAENTLINNNEKYAEKKEEKSLFSNFIEKIGQSNTFLGNITNQLPALITNIGKFALGAGLLYGVDTGKFDGLAYKLGLGGRPGSQSLFGSTGYVDAAGVKIIKGEDGKWYYEDGTEYTGNAYSGNSKYSSMNQTFNAKFLGNEARQLLTHGSNFHLSVLSKTPIIGKIIKKLSTAPATAINKSIVNSTNARLFTRGIGSTVDDAGKIIYKEGLDSLATYGKKGIKEATEEVAQEAIEKATKNKLMDAFEEALQKFVKNLDKLPFGKSIISSIDWDKTCKELTERVYKEVGSASAKAAGDAVGLVPVIGWVLDVVFFIADYIEGYQDAPAYFKVSDPSEEQHVLAGLTNALIGLIPFVGALVPTETLFNLIIDAIIKENPTIFGTTYLKQRLASEASIDSYNEAYGTDLTFKEYNKDVLKNYNWFEKGINEFKTNFNTAKDIASNTISNIKNGKGFFNSITDAVSDNFDKRVWEMSRTTLEKKARESLQDEYGYVDEVALKERLQMVIDDYLHTEKGRKYSKYEYGKELTDQDIANYQRQLTNAIYEYSNIQDTYDEIDSKYGSSSSSSKKTISIPWYLRLSSTVAGNNSIFNFVNAYNSLSGGASGISGKFVSQSDPRYANMSLGFDNVANKGCGPAAAVMALNQYAGKANMNSAVNMASMYQTGAGTDASFFADYYNRYGANARYIDGTSAAGQAGIINNISRGIPTVLMGADARNTSKSYSPFGPNNHYVVASGFDRSGNIIINDPEARRGNIKYNPRILNHVRLGIGISGGASTYSHELRNDATTQFVWSFFRERGYSDAATAGIMGNLQQESGIDPTRYQNNGGPGRGLAQWTVNQRHAVLEKFANDMGRDWTDLEAQCLFIDSEINGSQKNYFKKQCGSVDNFKALTDVAEAVTVFEKAYERAGSPNFEKRIEYGTYYYNQFSGKIYQSTGYVPVTSGTSSINSSTESTSNSSSGGILSRILGLFDTGFRGIFSGNKAEKININNTNSTATVDNPASITYTGNTPIDLLRSIKGKVQYSMSGARNPELGSADCSSTVQWAIKKATGIDIGGSTPVQYTDEDLKTVWYNNGKIATSLPDNIKENDILFFSRPNSDFTKGRTDRVGHVELYTGNGMMIGHGGGGDGYGPTEKAVPLGEGKNGGLIKVARLAASGSGLIDPSGLGKTSRLIYNRNRTHGNIIPISTGNGEYRYGMLYSGGESGVRTNNSQPISKEVALLLKTIVSLIQVLVKNTGDITNIYSVLLQIVDKSNVDEKLASQARAAINNLSSTSNSTNSNVEDQLSGLKATIDSLLSA